MILVSFIFFTVGVFVLTVSGIAYTYKGTRYSGIDSTFDSERKKYDEKDHRMHAILSGLSYAGFSVGAVAICVAMVMFLLAISTK